MWLCSVCVVWGECGYVGVSVCVGCGCGWGYVDVVGGRMMDVGGWCGWVDGVGWCYGDVVSVCGDGV